VQPCKTKLKLRERSVAAAKKKDLANAEKRTPCLLFLFHTGNPNTSINPKPKSILALKKEYY
jgi:hypothetical protein